MPSEIEAKFYLRRLEPTLQRVQELGGRLAVRRQLERNWRFDLPDGSLTARGAVLRLRMDGLARLTFKAKTEQPERREELELEVGDSQAAIAFLEALGFRQVGLYEKHREVYALQDCQVMFDELPFGSFTEIEAPSLASLQATAARLQLRWDSRVSLSYLELFERVRRALGLPVDQASFAAFAGLAPIDLEQLGLQDASGSMEHTA